MLVRARAEIWKPQRRWFGWLIVMVKSYDCPKV